MFFYSRLAFSSISKKEKENVKQHLSLTFKQLIINIKPLSLAFNKIVTKCITTLFFEKRILYTCSSHLKK